MPDEPRLRPVYCVRASIDSLTLEREVEGPGVVAVAHPDCYKLWREKSMTHQRKVG